MKAQANWVFTISGTVVYRLPLQHAVLHGPIMCRFVIKGCWLLVTSIWSSPLANSYLHVNYLSSPFVNYINTFYIYLYIYNTRMLAFAWSSSVLSRCNSTYTYTNYVHQLTWTFILGQLYTCEGRPLGHRTALVIHLDHVNCASLPCGKLYLMYLIYNLKFKFMWFLFMLKHITLRIKHITLHGVYVYSKKTVRDVRRGRRCDPWSEIWKHSM